jgi:hypothetical protein
MLQNLASRTARRNSIHKLRTNYSSLRRANALGRQLLVSGGYAPAAPSVRHYAQIPPGGQGGSGGFKFPMQQQYEKGDALKDFVRVLGFRSWSRSSRVLL